WPRSPASSFTKRSSLRCPAFQRFALSRTDRASLRVNGSRTGSASVRRIDLRNISREHWFHDFFPEYRMFELKIVVGSTRPARATDPVANWITRRAQEHGAFNVEQLDLRDWPLPFFSESLQTVADI